MTVIFVASSRPAIPPAFEAVSDKVLHAAAYAVLSVLCVRALSNRWASRITLGVAAAALAIATAYGASDEIHQHFVPPRQMDALDLLADASGAGIAAAGLYVWSCARRDIIQARNGV